MEKLPLFIQFLNIPTQNLVEPASFARLPDPSQAIPDIETGMASLQPSPKTRLEEFQALSLPQVFLPFQEGLIASENRYQSLKSRCEARRLIPGSDSVELEEVRRHRMLLVQVAELHQQAFTALQRLSPVRGATTTEPLGKCLAEATDLIDRAERLINAW